MTTPQGGIFALGTASHAYLEFDAVAAQAAPNLVTAVASLREPRTTMGGVNLVAGFRPELWRQVMPDDAPADVEGFNDDLTGADGFVIPATQHDAVMWISGSAYDVVFDMAREVIAALVALATVAEETSSWPYRHDRDLTGFIDGTENPTLIEAPNISLIPDGSPGAGGSVLLLQKWIHDATAWESLSVDRQERVIGRRKDDSAELQDKPSNSHVARTDQDTFGKVFRRNMPSGTRSRSTPGPRAVRTTSSHRPTRCDGSAGRSSTDQVLLLLAAAAALSPVAARICSSPRESSFSSA